MRWLPYPMVRIAGSYVAGVLLGIYFKHIFPFPWVVAAVAIAMAAFAVTEKFQTDKKQHPQILGTLGLVAIFFLGYARLVLFLDVDENHLTKLSGVQWYVAVVRSAPEEKTKSWRVEVDVVAAKTRSWRAANGRLLLYMSKKIAAGECRYGDRILVKGSPQEIKSPVNPDEFDFKRFLRFRNISHQQFVEPGQISFFKPATQKGIVNYSHQARAWSKRKLCEFIRGENERAIAVALVLGVTDGIDNDLLNAYAASGTMHVLAVSGMHVGIIYVIILFLFKPLNKYRWSRWLAACVSLLMLWAFAFVTGLSPSVLRAVTMFSFVALARPFGIQTNIYNTLASSALLLLIYNPCLILSVGFQLSYLAVIGIVYLQRPLYNLWTHESALGDWVWKITSVSIAAQLATFPLSLFYFHQFPTYFLLANLFAIPLSTLVLVVGICLLAVSPFTSLAFFTAMILEWLIKALNGVVFATEGLPFSLINDIHITALQCWLLIAILVTLILLFEKKSVAWLYLSFAFVVIFSIARWNHFFECVAHEKLTVYGIDKHQALEFIYRGHSFFVADTLLLQDSGRIQFHVQPHRLRHRVMSVSMQVPFRRTLKGVDYFRWGSKTLAWVKRRDYDFPDNGSIDFVVVSSNSFHKKEFDKIRPALIIFDGSNGQKSIREGISAAVENHVALRDVMSEGAFTY